MAAIRFTGRRSMDGAELNPGDTALLGESFVTNATVGNATISAASIVAGNIYRSGSTGNYTDTFDTSTNIMAALAGNSPSGPVVVGHSFKFTLTNSVAFTETLTLGAGMTAGSGVVTSVGTSAVREFLATITSTQTPVTVVSNGNSGSASVTWTLNTGQVALGEGINSSVIIQPGAAVSGTGVAAGTTVLGVTQGQGGTTGVTLSGTLTANITNVALTFSPSIVLNSTGSWNL